MEYKDISPSTVTEELLREMIMELKDGDQLPSQRELAEKLQVSRNAVKYALARLQKKVIFGLKIVKEFGLTRK